MSLFLRSLFSFLFLFFSIQSFATNSCSKIDFEKLSWPSRLSLYDQKAFSIALNISGSFEGSESWSNLTNNFDGMGLSMGLLNQTLGTGSLQPLLVEMRDKNAKALSAVLGAPRLKSLLSMLSDWERGRSLQATDVDAFYSPLDSEFSSEFESNFEGTEMAQSFETETLKTYYNIMDRSSASVRWAVDTLYNGSKFKPEWDRELRALSGMIPYKNIQLNAATRDHDLAMKYFNLFHLSEIRSYLLMFDFVVQNGGFYKDNISAYQSYLKANPQSTEGDRLKKIIEIRLARVRPQYREDVRRRKYTVMNGVGQVHGEKRNLPKEFCYVLSEKYNAGKNLNLQLVDSTPLDLSKASTNFDTFYE